MISTEKGPFNTAASYQYDPFGAPRGPANTLSQPFQFSTKPFDDKTGLSYYGYRFYVPALARWLTRDPIGEEGGINLYGFVRNNPVNWIDPFGLRDNAQRCGDYVKDKIDQSGLPDAMNAPPYHPFKWEETIIWWVGGVWALPGNKITEPWGEPIIPNNQTGNNKK